MLKRRRDGEGTGLREHQKDFSDREDGQHRKSGPGRGSKKYDFRKDLSRFNRKPNQRPKDR